MNNSSRYELLKLAAMVDGKTVLIPNLLHLLPEGWYDEPPSELLKRVNDEIDAWLKTYVVFTDLSPPEFWDPHDSKSIGSTRTRSNCHVTGGKGTIRC